MWPHEVETWFHSWYRGRVETLDQGSIYWKARPAPQRFKIAIVKNALQSSYVASLPPQNEFTLLISPQNNLLDRTLSKMLIFL